MSGGLTWVDSSQHKIKVVIIIVLKLNSRVNPRQGPDHKTGSSTWVDPGQCKDKSCYYHSLKTWFGGWLSMNKSSYYNSFKTRLGNRPKTRFRSWVREGQHGWPNIL